MKDFYYKEWRIAEKQGNTSYALLCKEAYRDLVVSGLSKPYEQRFESLKMVPPIQLN